MNFLNTAPWLHSYEMRINSTTSQLRLLSLAPGKQAEEPRSAQALSSISQKARPDTAQLFSIHTLKFWGLLGFRGLGERGLWVFCQISFSPPPLSLCPLICSFCSSMRLGTTFTLCLCRAMHKADLIYACTCMQQYIMTLRYFSATGMLLTELFSFPLFINKD